MDIYNSKFAKFVGWLVGSKTGRYAVTISSKTCCYEEDESTVSPIHRAEEEAHKRRIRDMGWINHMATYVWRLMTVGFKKSDLEVDAKAEAAEKVKLENK